MKKPIMAFIMIVLVYATVEALFYGSEWLLFKRDSSFYSPFQDTNLREDHRRIIDKMVQGKNEYLVHSGSLGWTIKPDDTQSTKANRQGFRGDREYTEIPPAGKIRLTTFGDSFTHCDGVSNSEMWQAVLESLNPKLEVLNFGVPGYGTDQAYLRYREDGKSFKTQYVLIGVMSENIRRVVNTYRPFYYSDTGIPLSKPYFSIEDDQLIAHENGLYSLSDYQELIKDPQPLLAALGEDDYWHNRKKGQTLWDLFPSVRMAKRINTKLFDPPNTREPDNIDNEDGSYNREATPYRVLRKILRQFYDEALAEGAQPVILFFPDHWAVFHYRKTQTKVYEPLLEELRENGYVTIDLMESLAKPERDEDVEKFFDGHYSPLGNQRVAEQIYSALKDQF